MSKLHYAAELNLPDGIHAGLIGEAKCGAGKGRSQYGLDATNREADVTCARCLARIAVASKVSEIKLTITADEELQLLVGLEDRVDMLRSIGRDDKADVCELLRSKVSVGYGSAVRAHIREGDPVLTACTCGVAWGIAEGPCVCEPPANQTIEGA